MEDTVFEKIYKVVRKIPRGKVATYWQIAALAGNPRWARVVGYALHVNPDPSEIPCYRVVNRQGKASAAFAFGGETMQIQLLSADGVEFVDVHVNMEKYLWRPDVDVNYTETEVCVPVNRTQQVFTAHLIFIPCLPSA